MDTDVALFLDQQIEVERDLGKRSFIDFYRMAWHVMDPDAYIEGRHMRVICYHLQLAARREIRRLLICIPPRHSKSLLCSVAFPAWVWTWWPSASFITASYDMRLAARDSLATRRLIESPWYRARWPEVVLQRDQHQKQFYQTTAGGARFTSSPSAGATGHGSDFNLFDDPHNVTAGESEAERLRAKTFWFESMSSRFNSPERGVSLVIQQRVHERDVADECIKRGYHSVVLPARFEAAHPQRSEFDWRRSEGEPLWPQKFDDLVLKGLWTEQGGDDSYAVAGQQQQRPAPREGGLFKRAWFRAIEHLPPDVMWVRAWDLASTEKMASSNPDWTAGVKLGFSRSLKAYIVGNVVRARSGPGGVVTLLKNTASLDGKKVPIFIPQDPGQAGKSQIVHLYSELDGYTLKSTTMTGSKTDRASPAASQAEAGRMLLYRASWNDDFLDEIQNFPMGGHDDQVDALACAYGMFADDLSGLHTWARETAEALKAEAEELRRAMGLPPSAPTTSLR